MPTSKKIILYLHGIECGPNGKKSKYIQENYDDRVIFLAPNMNMSLWNFTRANSLPRKLSLHASLEGCVDLASQYIQKELRKLQSLETSSSDVSSQDSTTERITFSRQDIEMIKTRLILIGSSWGGRCAIKLMEDFAGFEPYRVLLLAPALGGAGAIGSYLWPISIPESLPCNDRIMVIHGDQDDQVPVEASRELKQKFPSIEYREILHGDHKLNSALIQSGEFKKILDSWI